MLGRSFRWQCRYLTGPAIGQVSDENRSLVVPTGYAFAIWSLIFLLCFAYAAYQVLLLVGLLASVVILYGKPGPGPTFYLPYAAVVLWALGEIVANQYDASILTTGAAAFSGVLVALTLFCTLRKGQPGQGVNRVRIGTE